MSAIVTFWTHGDIVDLQAQLDANLEGTNNSVQACKTLDAGTAASWQTFYIACKGFTQEPAAWINTGTQADQGQAYQRELYAWQQKLSATCGLTVPAVDPTAGAPELGTYLKWGTALAAVFGVAYITAQVASTVRAFKPSRE